MCPHYENNMQNVLHISTHIQYEFYAMAHTDRFNKGSELNIDKVDVQILNFKTKYI